MYGVILDGVGLEVYSKGINKVGFKIQVKYVAPKRLI